MKNLMCLALFFGLTQAQAQITRQWAASFNGTGDYNDRITCIVRGADGFFYAAGSTVNPDQDRDFLILKLNSEGGIVWNRQYNGPGNGPDEITAIAIDPGGKLIATGLSKGVNTGQDYLTIQLNTDGDTLWTRRYDFAAEYDQPNSLFVDAAGTVYVTGQSDQDSTILLNDDYATVKYGNNGTLLWVKRFNGVGNALDRAIKVLADGQGNVYVTGRSDNGSDDDFVTLKYNSAGIQQWIRYDDRGGRDRATAMSFTPAGNLVVTGRSDNGSNDDFWTLQISAAGTELWTAAFDFVDNDRPVSMAVSASGNVYITGQSDNNSTALTNWDYLTLAYSPAGALLWNKRYDGPNQSDDIPTAIALDELSGLVYVTGESTLFGLGNISTLGYGTTGAMQEWHTTFSGMSNTDDKSNAVTIVPGGGCVVGGYEGDNSNSRNALVIRYNETGAQNWTQQFNGVGDNNDNVRAIQVDNLGNVLTAGYSVGGGDNRNMAFVKFDVTGNLVCQYSLTGTATDSEDDSQGIGVDVFGAPLLVGVTKNSGTSNDITFLKLDENCDSLLTKKIDGIGHGSDRVYDMTSDANGYYYLTGRTDAATGPALNDNAFTAKFDAYGTLQWTATYNSAGTNADRGVVVRRDPAGAVYVAGRTFNGQNSDIFLLKYNANGIQQWVKTWNGGNNREDEPRDMEIDLLGNIIVSGKTGTLPDSVFDYVTVKYSPDGVQTWAVQFDGTGHGNDEPQALAVDGAGNVVVSGKSDKDASATADYDIVTVKYDPAGNLLWVNAFGDGQDDTPDDLAINSGNLIYLTAHSNAGGAGNSNFDMHTRIFDPNGNIVWSDQYDGLSGADDIPNLIYLKGSDFYVAGSSIQTGQQRNIIVLKYSGTVGLESVGGAPVNIAVSPNPFGRFLDVSAASADQVEVRFELIDPSGKIVFSQLYDGITTRITLPELSQGAYFYRLLTGEHLLSTGRLMHME